MGSRVLFYSVAAFVVFIAAAALGYVMPSEEAVNSVRSLAVYASLPPLPRAFAIFLNNVFVASLLLLASLVVVPGFYILAANGYVIGSLLAVASAQAPLPLLVARIVPHGSLELLAYSYVTGVSLSSLEGLVRGRLSAVSAAAELLRAFSYAGVILLAAAVVESYLVM